MARELQISLPIVNRDPQYLRLEAKQDIKENVDEKLSLEYQKYLISLDNSLAKTWDIANINGLQKSHVASRFNRNANIWLENGSWISSR